MEQLQFKKCTTEKQELINFLCGNTWPFHAGNKQNPDDVKIAFEKGWYADDRETFWIEQDGNKVGLVIIHDISDTIPLFDLRLSAEARGQGIGTKTLLWLKDYLFNKPHEKIRIEAYTRSDNLAMRKCFTKAGFVKEGYLRQAWENTDGTVSDSVLYGAIRMDWENNCITPIKLDVVPY